MTASEADDKTQLVEIFAGRIQALGRAHEASISLREIDQRASDFERLVEGVLSPYLADDEKNIDLQGPKVTLPAEWSTPVGLTLHELATNALKYGAFSKEGGTVSLRWRASGKTLFADWTEDGGPDVTSSGTIGSGKGWQLITSVFEGAGGKIETDRQTDGLRVSFEIPL